MNLYLLQHGEARLEEEDPERHLSDAGRAALRKTAGFATAHIRVSRVLHSGKPRARETAEVLAEALRPAPAVEAADALEPMADPKVWAERVEEGAADLMLVGHLPHLSRLASLLLCGDEERPLVTFQMGGIVCLQQVEEGWSIAWIVVPSIL